MAGKDPVTFEKYFHWKRTSPEDILFALKTPVKITQFKLRQQKMLCRLN